MRMRGGGGIRFQSGRKIPANAVGRALSRPVRWGGHYPSKCGGEGIVPALS